MNRGGTTRNAHIFYQSQDSSNRMWAQKAGALRDSYNIDNSNASGLGSAVQVKPMFNFGRAPNTAGGNPFGSIGQSQEGGVFTATTSRFRSPEQFMQANRTGKNYMQRRPKV